MKTEWTKPELPVARFRRRSSSRTPAVGGAGPAGVQQQAIAKGLKNHLAVFMIPTSFLSGLFYSYVLCMSACWEAHTIFVIFGCFQALILAVWKASQGSAEKFPKIQVNKPRNFKLTKPLKPSQMLTQPLLAVGWSRDSRDRFSEPGNLSRPTRFRADSPAHDSAPPIQIGP